jgi:hypothetical protein
MRWLVVVFVFCFLAAPLPAKASDIYVTQTGSGAGTSCQDAHSAAWFSNSANWGLGAGQISAGDTVHLCGTFVGTAGQQLLSARGGSITILFEPGTLLTSPVWSANGAINISNLSNVTIDGGGTGVIENTDNGTGQRYRWSSRAIDAQNCAGCVVKNLTVANLYVHTSLKDTTVAQTAVNCVNFVGSNSFTVTSITCHDAGWGLAGNGNNLTISHNEIYNVDHGVAVGASGNVNGFSIHDNHIHDFANWDTSKNAYHHDGVHMWGQSGGAISNGTIYNNLFDGDSGVNITGDIFLQDSVQNVAVYNNIFTALPNRTNHTLWFEANSTTMPNGPASGNSAYNNTIEAGGHSEGGALLISNQLNFSAYANVLIGGQSDISLMGGLDTWSRIDNNVYEDLLSFGDNNAFGYFGKSYQTLSEWTRVCGCDANSTFLPPSELQILSTGQLAAGSPVGTAGANLPFVVAGAGSAAQ